ncbi:MAG TPA: alpha/beta hydrolase-fold protein [Fimbriimonadaceae bacterium]|nr:alpha/beta hydrolase-fold protein [Fimbriimonadaceae bacterium]
MLAVLIALVFTPPSVAPVVEEFELKSKVFGNTRTIRVVVPPDYSTYKASSKKVPVFYVLDGIMSFHGIGYPETVTRLQREGKAKPFLTVLVDNGASTRESKSNHDRSNEYLPFPDVGFPGQLYPPNPAKPEGSKHPSFLIQDVMSEVESRYSVAKGPENTAIAGYSYSGVAALYASWNRPDVFGTAIVESAPFWIGEDFALLKYGEARERWPSALYVAHGGRESDWKPTQEMHDLLTIRLRDFVGKHHPKTRTEFFRDPTGQHNPPSWKARLERAILFAFGK